MYPSPEEIAAMHRHVAAFLWEQEETGAFTDEDTDGMTEIGYRPIPLESLIEPVRDDEEIAQLPPQEPSRDGTKRSGPAQSRRKPRCTTWRDKAARDTRLDLKPPAYWEVRD